jgi:phosphoglycerol transferase MdoB-like AlkP superfamily enzyme
MNKKVNTILFILGATVFNIIVTILSFLTLLVIYAKALIPLLPDTAHMWSFPFLFLLSLAVAFIVYRRVLNYIMKKVEMEKYFDPLFVRRQKY